MNTDSVFYLISFDFFHNLTVEKVSRKKLRFTSGCRVPRITWGHISIQVQALCWKPSLYTELDVLVKRGKHVYAWIMTYSVETVSNIASFLHGYFAARRKHATHLACHCRRWFSWILPSPSTLLWKNKPLSFSTDGLWTPRHGKEKSCQIMDFHRFFWFRSRSRHFFRRQFEGSKHWFMRVKK